MSPGAPQPRPSRLAALSQFTSRQPKPLVATVGFVSIGLMGLIDYWLTSLHIALPIYYLIPILGLAWFIGWRASVIAIILSGVINSSIDILLTHNFHNLILIHVFSAVVFVISLIAAWEIATVRLLVEYYYRGEVWKAILKPIRVGQRIAIVPVWLAESYADDPAATPSDIRLLLEPGKAFGTGSHPTTQMCLAMLETYLKPGDQVFDLGCGTGILSVAAIKLGAGSVLAADIDPEAENTTRKNATLNDVVDKIEFRLGSLDLVLNAKQSGDDHSTIRLPDHSTSSQFNITVANILAHAVVNLLKEGLAQTLTPNGTILLSGIRAEQADDVATAIQAAGLTIIEQRQSLEWVAIAAKRG